MEYGLIGDRLGHSYSPRIHACFGDYDYRLYPMPLGQLQETLEKRQFRGLNITIPYKQKIIPHCKKLHETAARYGAVNVLDCRTGIGYNTDCVGFLQSLQGIGLEGEVLVCGAGGVGRMFAVEAALHGAAVTLAVREGSVSGAHRSWHGRSAKRYRARRFGC